MFLSDSTGKIICESLLRMPKKTKSNVRDYGRCESCGGQIGERHVTLHRRYHGKLFEFQNVPVGICRQCGERLYHGPVLEELQRIAESNASAKKFIKVPVFEYQAA